MLSISNDKTKQRTLDRKLELYLKQKQQKSSGINPSYETELSKLMPDNGTLSLRCSCTPVAPRFALRNSQGNGYILAHAPGESCLHLPSCAYADKHSDTSKSLSFCAPKRLIDFFLFAGSFNVLFKPFEETATPLFQRWPALLSRMQANTLALSDTLFAGLKSKALFTRSNGPALWLDVTSSADALNEQVLQYGSIKDQGPFLLVQYKQTDHSITKVAFPVASMTNPLVVFNEFERQVVFHLLKRIDSSMRIHSSYECQLSELPFNALCVRKKGSKKSIYLLFNVKSEQWLSRLKSQLPNSEIVNLSSLKDIDTLPIETAFKG